ncbi:MAG: translation initiation factor IF-3 [Clostridia bacterium]
MLTNYDIREREVRLIDENGTQLGIVPTPKAMSIADGKNLDLVMISPQANPPVCKLMNYSKYRFDQIKREKEERKNRKNVELKEIRLSAVIDVGDVEIKSKKAREFILDGQKVRLSILMRGRQQAHPEISVKVMEDFFEKVSDIAQMEKKPNQMGRTITMIIAPIIKK